jgi:hypothetical protein
MRVETNGSTGKGKTLERRKVNRLSGQVFFIAANPANMQMNAATNASGHNPVDRPFHMQQ